MGYLVPTKQSYSIGMEVFKTTNIHVTVVDKPNKYQLKVQTDSQDFPMKFIVRETNTKTPYELIQEIVQTITQKYPEAML